MLKRLPNYDYVEVQIDIENGQPVYFSYLNGAGDECIRAEEMPENMQSQLNEFMRNAYSWDEAHSPMPDGSFIIPFERGIVLHPGVAIATATALGDAAVTTTTTPPPEAQSFIPVELLSPEPTIPLLLQVFSLSLRQSTIENQFNPAYHDLRNAYLRGAAFNRSSRIIRVLRAIAFCAHAARIVAECIVADWLGLTWRQFIWLVVSLVAGGALARWL